MKKQNLLYWIVGAAIAALLLLSFGFASRSEGFAGSSEGAPTFTMYYANWCPHCQPLKPIFQEFSAKKSIQVNKKTVFLEMVEADENPDKITADGVKGFPTFKLKKADGKTIEYDGDRTPSGWLSFLQQQI
jgi:thiol-disulfide isomerase/thioredoxin